MTIRVVLSGYALSMYPETEWLDGDRAVRISKGDGEGWSFILPAEPQGEPLITRDEDGSLTFALTLPSPANNVNYALPILAAPSNAGGPAQLDTWLYPTDMAWVESAQMKLDGSGGLNLKAASYDHERGVHVVQLKNLSEAGAPGYQDWGKPENHNWYNRHRVMLHNMFNEPVSIPIAFEGGNNAAFYVVGGSPLFRDTNGEPTGTPIQISKNWHEQPFWYHLYSSMEVKPGTHELEHTFAHSKWGKAYAAAHAQLSLIGWGYNQQWDESSLGAFGESITYDPDMTLSRAMVDDVRPFLVKAKKKWSWTGNVGGANFLVYASQAGYKSPPDHQLGRMRTHYEYTGPNLTKVTYSGVTRDGKIEAKITTQLGRTDDLVRAYYHLEYTVLSDVAYNRFALFQVAADRYADNGFTRYAYGHADGVTADLLTDMNHQSTGYASQADRGIPLEGDSPWVMLYDSEHNQGDLPEHLANVAFVVRDYDIKMGNDHLTTPHINIIRTYNGPPNAKWSQMAFELGLPFDPQNKTIPAGSILKATVEYLVPPADKGAYYGASDYLTDLPAESYQSTEMALLLASGNQLEVTPSIGTLLRTHPIELEAAQGVVAAQFLVTGGLGYTPVTIEGLARPDGWRLERKDAGAWVELGQAVHGNDYWQSYDNSAVGTFELVFNIHNQGTQEYRLARKAL